MNLAEAVRRGILKSPSWKRWLAHAAVPGIAPSCGRNYDFTTNDLAVMTAFEIGAGFGSLALATELAREASQKARAGVLLPIIARGEHWTLTVDLEEIVNDIHTLS